MTKNPKSIKTDLLILCGGRGKRLGNLSKKTPKPMLDVKGKPFLELLMGYVYSFGFQRIILCSGYKHSLIKKCYSKQTSKFKLLFSHEKKPLGTAGAIRHALKWVKSKNFLVMNGDSFCKVDLADFLKFHINKKALCTVVLSNKVRRTDTGSVIIGSNKRIKKFFEKEKINKQQLSNAGIYCFQKRIIEFIPSNKKVSLEKEIFPYIVNEKFYGYATSAAFIDIGTPLRYKQAQKSRLLNIL